MAYTPINKPADYFNTKLYTGNGTADHAITGVGFQPDWVWLKQRANDVSNRNHMLFDINRGTQKALSSNTTGAEDTSSGYLTSYDSDGFTLGNSSVLNRNTTTYASWNWLAAGTAPSKTYAVTVVSDSGNKYRFDGYGTSAVTLEISEGGTYRFDQSDSSNSGHPLRFSTTSDGTHGGGSEYTTGVTTVGTPGSTGAYTEITVAASAPTLYYYCSVHSGMGGQANTPTTNSFSNFDGSIQSNISPNTTSGFSIVSFTGNSTAGATVGHGLGTVPSMIILKSRNSTDLWFVQHTSLGATKFLRLNDTNASTTQTNVWNDTEPTSSVFSLGNGSGTNGSSNNFIAYCFAEKKGFSKFGSYTGNGNADGTFVYTGFKPAMILLKRTDSTASWFLYDNKRDSFNEANASGLYPNLSNAEFSGTSNVWDFTSNGFKGRASTSDTNASGGTYIYMAFAENPLVTSGGTPATAR